MVTSEEARRHVAMMKKYGYYDRIRLMKTIEFLSARRYPDGSGTVSNVEAANYIFRQNSERRPQY